MELWVNDLEWVNWEIQRGIRYVQREKHECEPSEDELVEEVWAWQQLFLPGLWDTWKSYASRYYSY